MRAREGQFCVKKKMSATVQGYQLGDPLTGADPGGGILGVPPLLGDPKTSKRGKNVTRVCATAARFSI